MARTLLYVAGLCATPLSAQGLSVPPFWGSSMVLQMNVANVMSGVDVPESTVTANYLGGNFTNQADAAGNWRIALPSTPPTTSPFTIAVTSSSGGGALELDDVVVGNVFVASGQSNMELSVEATAFYNTTLQASIAYGSILRMFRVAEIPDYYNVTSPQTNLTASIPWSRASPTSVIGQSAEAYYLGLQAAAAHPTIPVGIISSSWGATAIQVWMSPKALAACPNAAPVTSRAHRIARMLRDDATHMDRALGVAAMATPVGACPTIDSTLYNAMIAPLQQLPIAGLLWYQGESNSDDPIGYKCLQRAMVEDWRSSWAAVGASAATPFIFTQISAWPTGATGVPPDFIPVFRVAVEDTLTLPNTAMVVAADIADPSGAWHPIHPMFKAEVGRRAFLAADNLVYGNTSSPISGPRPVSVVFDQYDTSWGDFHYQYGSGSYVCNVGSTTFMCGGVRVTFDQPIRMRSFYNDVPLEWPALQYYGFKSGAPSGFELWANGNLTGTGSWGQPAVLTTLRDAYTVQLNVTWINPFMTPVTAPLVLRYMWSEYPAAAPIENAFGQPAGPFNATVTTA